MSNEERFNNLESKIKKIEDNFNNLDKKVSNLYDKFEIIDKINEKLDKLIKINISESNNKHNNHLIKKKDN